MSTDRLALGIFACRSFARWPAGTRFGSGCSKTRCVQIASAQRRGPTVDGLASTNSHRWALFSLAFPVPRRREDGACGPRDKGTGSEADCCGRSGACKRFLPRIQDGRPFQLGEVSASASRELLYPAEAGPFRDTRDGRQVRPGDPVPEYSECRLAQPPGARPLLACVCPAPAMARRVCRRWPDCVAANPLSLYRTERLCRSRRGARIHHHWRRTRSLCRYPRGVTGCGPRGRGGRRGRLGSGCG